MPALRRGKISTYNMPFNYTSNVGSGLHGFNPCAFLMASCANKIIKKKSFGLFYFLDILKYLVSCTNKIISCTYNVNYANWRKLEILNFINLMHVSFWDIYSHNKKSDLVIQTLWIIHKFFAEYNTCSALYLLEIKMHNRFQVVRSEFLKTDLSVFYKRIWIFLEFFF